MNDFSGFEPQVGEIRALRTFRIGPGGILYPLFNATAWTDFANTAQCSHNGGGVQPRAAARQHQNASNSAGDLNPKTAPHTVPDTECTCGYYAYATMNAASEYPHAQHVLAVVACWGRVIAGTRGVRAEHARVEAIWMSRQVPESLQDHLTERYPSVRIYGDKEHMIAEHPPTVLDCYEPSNDLQRRRYRLTGLRLALLGAIAIGSLPASWTWRHSDARLLWLAELAFFLIGAAVLRRRRDDVAARSTMLLFAAAALWLVAPFAGAAGTLLLRLPILQIAIIGTVHRARLARAACTFPATIAGQS